MTTYPDLDRWEMVRGVRQVSEPTGGVHGHVVLRLGARLLAFVEEHRLGTVMTDAGFVLQTGPATVRGPDVAFVAGKRLEPTGVPLGFFSFGPDLAIEIVSPGERWVTVDEKVMARGHERFDIYCQPCHGATGNGDGMVVQRGFKRPPAYSEQRLRDAAPGYLFDVISRGFGAMPDYAAQIKVTDRWAIVAYVRALQLSAHAALEDVPAADRGRLDQPPAGADAPRAETERH